MPDRSDISPLSITDGKISNEARIGHSKLATAAEGQILVAQSNGKFAAKTLAGDVTLAADGSTTSSVTVASDGTTVVTGDTGDTGAKGDKGDTGVQGATGGAGADGSDGSDGADGSDASVTAENVDGALGFTGSTAGLVKRTADNTFSLDTATYSTTGHTHSDATTSAAGLMSGTDKTKLDGVATAAEVNVLSDWDATTGDAVISNKPNVQYTSAIADATTSAAGLLSSTDKTKLDGVATGATSTAINDSSALTTEVWSASKIISYLVTFYATLSHTHKYTASILWEGEANAINEAGWSKSSTSGAWGASQSHSAFAQTSTTGSGTGALFSVATDSGGIPTFTWVSGGTGYAISDTLTFTDPYLTGEVCVLYVSGVHLGADGVSFSGTTGSMVCNLNHDLDTEYVVIAVRDENKESEDVGFVSLTTVVDANNVKLEYSVSAGDYPGEGTERYVTIIG